MDHTVRLLFFSLLQNIVGSDEIDREIPETGISTGDLLDQLFEEFEGLASWKDKLLIAVNCEYADANTQVKPGDEVAIMPPVQGG